MDRRCREPIKGATTDLSGAAAPPFAAAAPSAPAAAPARRGSVTPPPPGDVARHSDCSVLMITNTQTVTLVGQVTIV